MRCFISLFINKFVVPLAVLFIASAVASAQTASGKFVVTDEFSQLIERAGGLRGYGGGLWRKKFLLDLERRGSDPLAGTPLGAAMGR